MLHQASSWHLSPYLLLPFRPCPAAAEGLMLTTSTTSRTFLLCECTVCLFLASTLSVLPAWLRWHKKGKGHGAKRWALATCQSLGLTLAEHDRGTPWSGGAPTPCSTGNGWNPFLPLSLGLGYTHGIPKEVLTMQDFACMGRAIPPASK